MNPSSSVDGGGGGGNSVEDISKLGLFKRFKALYKQYWYVMLPVHIVTSTGWMVGFYYMSQRYGDPLRNSVNTSLVLVGC